MKNYEKPTLKVVQIRVKEDIANEGNTTVYEIDGYAMGGMGMITLGDIS